MTSLCACGLLRSRMMQTTSEPSATRRRIFSMTACSPLAAAAGSLVVAQRAASPLRRRAADGAAGASWLGIRTRGAAVRPAENGSTATRADGVLPAEAPSPARDRLHVERSESLLVQARRGSTPGRQTNPR